MKRLQRFQALFLFFTVKLPASRRFFVFYCQTPDNIEGHSAIITVRFGEENSTEDTISIIVREALEQTERNIEEDEINKS